MRWKSKSINKPNLGDTQYKKTFAWLPIKLKDCDQPKNVVWLEYYIKVYKYKEITKLTKVGSHMHKYKANEWVYTQSYSPANASMYRR